MGDLRMFFAEDTNKVNKIVKGQFDLFQSMYKPFLEECETKNLLRFSSAEASHTKLVQVYTDYSSITMDINSILRLFLYQSFSTCEQDSSLSATRSLVSSLPASVRSQMGKSLGEKKFVSETGINSDLSDPIAGNGFIIIDF
jgi:translocator assembly and maintenance protein 41